MAYIPKVTFREYDLDTIMKGLDMEEVKSVVFDKLIPNIKIAIEKNKKECILCFVEDCTVLIPKVSYSQTLQTLEKYYLTKENYTNCSLLRDLQTKIKE